MDGSEMDFYEDYESPFDFNTGVNKNYLYLSPSGNTSPPGSPTLQKFGNSLFSKVTFAVLKPVCNWGFAWLYNSQCEKGVAVLLQVSKGVTGFQVES